MSVALIMNDKFAVFILTHGRAKNVTTYNTLLKHGYTGKIFLLVDDEDNQAEEYKKIYGSKVIIFNKSEAALITDSGDNFTKRNSVIYARNINFKIAMDMELTHFWQLDDDYTTFRFTCDDFGRYITKQSKIQNLDRTIKYCLEFLDSSGFDSVAFSQGGDFIGGENAGIYKKYIRGEIPRKVMNSFFFRVDKPIKFLGRMNDDVNMYISFGNKGKLFGTITPLRLEQAETQENSGGLTDMYRQYGTYVKSFYSVLYMPSAVVIKEMGRKNKRLHHSIKWNNVAPKILSESLRRASH
jgi:hypothetical protein